LQHDPQLLSGLELSEIDTSIDPLTFLERSRVLNSNLLWHHRFSPHQVILEADLLTDHFLMLKPH
jgi:hypothetical protein